MNRFLRAGVPAALALALAACGSDGTDDSGPVIKVDELAAGSYVVSTGSESAPTVGKYYATGSSRLLVLNNDSDQASQLYRQTDGGSWVAVPRPAADTTVTLLRSSALPATTPDLATLAGSHAVRLPSGAAARFTLQAGGDLVAGDSSCKLSGKASAGGVGGTLKLALTATGCGDLPASSTGVLIVDSDYAPARFRLVADDGSKLVDLWAYAE